jgi:hypothetical protein
MISFFKKKTEAEMVALARLSLCSVDPYDDGFEGYTDLQMKKVESDCKKLLEYKTLMAVINDLKIKQRNLIAGQATKDNLDFARGVLNGLGLVSERLRILASKVETKGERDYDKFNPI